MLDHATLTFTLTRNYIHDKIVITNTRAIAQLVEHLVYTRANVFSEESIMQSTEFILVKN